VSVAHVSLICLTFDDSTVLTSLFRIAAGSTCQVVAETADHATGPAMPLQASQSITAI
jgi:hypothetical protein